VTDAGGAVADADRDRAAGGGVDGTARAADGGRAEPFVAERLLQVAQLAGPLLGPQLVTADDGDSGRVVAPVFESPQTVQHDAQRRSRADVSHDSTHGP
jgi:hypothetical protein